MTSKKIVIKMKILLIVCLGVLFQCCSEKVNLFGEYSSRIAPYTVEFFPDSTFAFTQNGEHNYRRSNGIWKLSNGNKILLNSYYQNNYIGLEQKQSFNKQKQLEDSVKIHIDIPNLKHTYKPNYKLLVYSRDKLISELYCNNLDFNIHRNASKNIKFQITTDARMPSRMFDTLETKPLLDLENNTISVNIAINYNDSLFNYQIFRNEPIIIKSNKIKVKNHWLNKK